MTIRTANRRRKRAEARARFAAYWIRAMPPRWLALVLDWHYAAPIRAGKGKR